MSTREQVHTMIDEMNDEQLAELVVFISNYYEPNTETLNALKEVEDMKKHPENYKAYDDVEEMIEELLKWNYNKTDFTVQTWLKENGKTK